MKLKTVDVNGSTYAEVKDGKPVYIGEGDREVAFDAAQSIQKIKDLNAEAKGHREAKEGFETKLKSFEGIDNPEDARKALEFQKNAKDGEYVTAGKVEEMKAGWKRTQDENNAATLRAHAQRVQELEGKLTDVTGKFNQEMVGNAFANSKFIREKIASPLGMIQATFGSQFKVEDGKLRPYHSDGSPIMSATGETAGFDEAIERVVLAYPDKDLILKGSQSSGGGARPSNGGGNGGGRTMTKAAFDALPPAQQAATMSGKDRPQLVD